MIEELLWVVRLVRMIFSAGGYSKRVQITSDLHPLFFSGEIVRVAEGVVSWLIEVGGDLVAEDTDVYARGRNILCLIIVPLFREKLTVYEEQI